MTYDNRDQTLSCDECPEQFELDHKERDPDDNFKRTMMESKAAGWRSFRGPDNEWAHACPSCVAAWAKRKNNNGR